MKIGKKYLGDKFVVHIAGIEAHGLDPNALKAMAEIGIDISNQTSDVIDPELLNRADYVITLCGDANDKCPMTPPHVKREHWGLEDLAKAEFESADDPAVQGVCCAPTANQLTVQEVCCTLSPDNELVQLDSGCCQRWDKTLQPFCED